ncbi:hypothetical protein BH10PLA1_BH10PLA1_18480 [soil metagenome]
MSELGYGRGKRLQTLRQHNLPFGFNYPVEPELSPPRHLMSRIHYMRLCDRLLTQNQND